MKKRILYGAAALFGVPGIWFLLSQTLGGVDFITIYLNVLPASWIYSSGIHSILVMDAGHIPMLTPLGIILLYGIPCVAFYLAARRAGKAPLQPPGPTRGNGP